jgi:hypothetical protein
MDEEISIIDEKTRNEKIKKFFIKNKKLLISIISFLILNLLLFYSYQIYKKNQEELISNNYNTAVIEYKNGNKTKTISALKEIVNEKDSTYSPLALYFLIDNKLIENKNEINSLFNILIDKTTLEKEIRNLIIYKKALYNADSINENELLNILNPLINSGSVWKSHALYLLAEYFYSRDEKQKSKEFFNEIIILENSNNDLKKEAQKRVNRDLSD